MATSAPALRSATRVIEAQAGVVYTVPLPSGAPVSGKPLTAKAPKAVVVTRRSKDLLVTHPDGQIDSLEGFFETCQGGACALELGVPGQASPVVITPETAVAEQMLPGSEYLLYTGGEAQAFAPLAAQDAVVHAVLSPPQPWAVGWGQLFPSAAVLPLLGLGSPGGTAATVVAAAIILHDGGSDASPTPQPEPEVRVVRGTVVAGPVVAGNQFTVTVYDSSGNKLGAQSNLPAGGAYEVGVGSYNGAITVVVTDGADGHDYRDEADGAPKDLGGALAAVGLVSGAVTVVNVNPLTTLAARRAGVDVASAATGAAVAAPAAATVEQANAQVAKAMGLGSTAADLVSSPVVAVIQLDGTPNPDANNYGKILAALSGAEAQTGQSTQQLIETINTGFDTSGSALTDATKKLLIDGGQKADVNVAPILGFTIEGAVSDGLVTAAEAQQLTPAQIQQLTSTQIGMFNNAALAALTPEQMAVLSPQQVAAITPLSALSDAQLAALTPAQLGQVTPAQIDTLTPEQIRALGGDVTALPAQALASLDAAQVAAITPLNQLNNDQLAALTPAQLINVTPAQIDTLTPAQITALGGDVTALPADALASFDAAQVAAITPLNQLNNDQLAALTPAQLINVTPAQIDTLTPEQITALGGDVTALPADALARFDAAQVAAITPLSQLSDTQLAALTPAQLINVTPAQIDTLTPAQITALGGDVVALPADALASLDAAQVAAITPLSQLNNDQLAALTGDQLAQVTATQIDGLTPAQIAALGTDIAALPAAALASIDATQATGLTPAQLNALVSSAALTAGVDEVGTNTWASGTINDATPALSGTFTGTLVAGAVLAVYDGATRVGSATVSGNTWSLTPVTALGEGSRSLTVRVEVAGGAQGSASAAIAIAVDTQAPTASLLPGVVGSALTAAELAANQSVAVVNVEAGQAWTLTLTGTSGARTFNGTGTGADQSVVLGQSDVDALGQGAVSVSLTAQDAVGNVRTIGTGADFAIATLPPGAPVLTLLAPATGGVSQAEATAGAFTLSAAAGSSVVVNISNGAQNISKTVTATGSAQTIALTASDLLTLGDGTLSITAQATDSSGNVSPLSNTLAPVLDTQAPVFASGPATFVAVGSAAGSTVYTTSGSDVGTQGVVYSLGGANASLFNIQPSTGVVTWAGAASSTPVNYAIDVIATDAAGNATTRAVNVRVVDRPWLTISSSAGNSTTLNATSGEVTYTFTFANGDAAFTGVTGFDVNDVVVDGGTLVAGSFTAVNAKVYSVRVTPTANSTGSISIDVAAGAGQGDFGGQSNVPTAAAVTFVQPYDTALPAVPTLALASGVTSGADGASQAEALAGPVTVSAEAGSEVTVLFTGANGAVSKTLLATGSAQPVVLTAADLVTLGNATVSVKASTVDAAGNPSGNTSTQSFSLDASGPTLHSTPLAVALSHIAGSSGTSEGETIALTFTFDGPVNGLTSGTANGILTVGGLAVDAVWSGSDGSATRTLTYTIAAGHNGQAALVESALQAAFAANITDANGNAFVYTANAGNIPNLDVGGLALPVVDTQAPTLTASYSVAENTAADAAPKTVALLADETVTWSGLGGTDASSFTLDASGALAFKAATNFEAKSSYSITAAGTDAAGNATTQAITVQLSNVNEAPTASGSIDAQSLLVSQSGWTLNLAGYFADVDATVVANNETRSYALTSGTLPAGLNLNTNTGVISGTPSSFSANTSYTVTMTDSGGLTATQTFTLRVIDDARITAFTVSDAQATAPNTANMGRGGESLTFVVTFNQAVNVSAGAQITFLMNGEEVLATCSAGVSGGTTASFTGGVVPSFSDGTNTSISALTSGTIAATAANGGRSLSTSNFASLSYTGYEVDNTPPPQLVINNLAFSNDTGVSSTDRVTNVLSHTLTGTLGEPLAAGQRLLGFDFSANNWKDLTDMVDGTSLTWTGFAFRESWASTGSSGVLAFRLSDAVGNWGEQATIAGKSFTLDPLAPQATSAPQIFTSSRGGSPGTLKAGDTVTLILNFNEKVYLSGSASLQIDVGGTSVAANCTAGSGTDMLTFVATIPPNVTDDNGISIPAGSLTLGAGSTLTDLAGNPYATPYLAASDNSAYKVDAVAPALSAVTITVSREGIDLPDGSTVTIGDYVLITATYNDSVVGNPTTAPTLTIGNVSGLQLVRGGTDGNTRTWVYVIEGNINETGAISVQGDFTTGLTDAAGNPATGTVTPTGSYIADTTPPAALALSLRTDTAVGDDQTTSDGTFDVSGFEANTTWQYSLNGGSTWNTGTGTSFVATPGSYAVGSIRVRQTDAAGNHTVTASTLAYTIDTVAAAPNVALVLDSTNLESGAYATDGITNSGALTTPTNIEDGAVLEYRVKKGSGAFSDWASSYTAPDTDGSADDSYTVEVRQTDAAGNVGTTTISFTLDTQVAMPDAKLTTDTGLTGYLTDLVSQVGAVTAPTNLESGDKVEYRYKKDDGSFSEWANSYAAPLVDGSADGLYTVEIRKTDKAENIQTQTLTYRLDTTKPKLDLDRSDGETTRGWGIIASATNTPYAIHNDASNLTQAFVTETGSGISRVSIAVNKTASPGTLGGESLLVAGTTLKLDGTGLPPTLTDSGGTVWKITYDGANGIFHFDPNTAGTALPSILASRLLREISYQASTLPGHAERTLSVTVTDTAGNASDAAVTTIATDNVGPVLTMTSNSGSTITDTALNFVRSQSRYASLPAVSLGGDLTMMAWVYAEGTQPQYSRIFDIGNGQTSNNLLVYFDNGGKLRVQFINGSTYILDYLLDMVIPVNAWNHIAVTVDTSNKLTIYLNGVDVGGLSGFNLSNVPIATATRSSALIGKSNWASDGANGHFEGGIRDVRIYDDARSAVEVLADMRGDVNVSDSALKVYYPLTNSNTASGLSGQAPLSLTNFPASLTGQPDALNFDKNRAQWADLPDVTLGGDLTIQMWYYANGAQSNATRLLELGSGAPSNNVILYFDNGYLRFQAYSGTGIIGGVNSSPILTNTWTHVALTVSTSNVATIYVNGEVQGTATLSAGIADMVRSNTYLGKGLWPTDPYFNGSMKDVRVYDDARTQAEIRADIAGATVDVADSSLRLYYPGTGGSTASGLSGQASLVYSSTPAGQANAFNLDSSRQQWLDLPDVMLGGDLTLEAQVYFNTNQVDPARIFDISNGEANNNVLVNITADQKVRVDCFNGGATQGVLVSTAALTLGAWQHVAVTVTTGRVLTIYINGVASGSMTLGASGIPDMMRTNTWVGKSPWPFDPNQGHFNGSIKDIRIYDDARSAAEVASDRNGTIDTSDVNLRAYYPATGGSTASGLTGQPNLTLMNHGAINRPVTVSNAVILPVDLEATLSEDTSTVTDASLIKEVSVQVGGLVNGGLNERLVVFGESLAFSGSGSASVWESVWTPASGDAASSSGTFVFKGENGRLATLAETKELLDSLAYQQTTASEGTRSFTIRATDQWGNVSAVPVISSIVINSSTPVLATATTGARGSTTVGGQSHTSYSTTTLTTLDTNKDGVLGEKFIVTFRDAVEAYRITTLSNWTLSGGATLGTGATIEALDATTLNGVTYATRYLFTRGTGGNYTTGTTLTIAAAHVVDAARSQAAANQVVTMTDIVAPLTVTPPAAISTDNYVSNTEKAGSTTLTYTHASASTGDQLLVFRDGVQIKTVALTGTSTNVTLTGTEWGADGMHNFSVRMQDAAGNLGPVSVYKQAVVDSSLAQGWNTLRASLDTTSPGTPNQGDKITVTFNEAVTLTNGSLSAAVFGSGATVAAIAPFNGKATTWEITLGTSPAANFNNQTITFSSVTDMAGNSGTVTGTTGPAVFDAPANPWIANVTSDNILNSTEKNAGQTFRINVAGLKNGDVVRLSVDGVLHQTITANGTDATNGYVNATMQAADWGGDGERSLSATVQRGSNGPEIQSLSKRAVYVAADGQHWSQAQTGLIWFDPETLTQVNGSKVSSWSASAGGSTATQARASSQPTLVLDGSGRARLYFNGGPGGIDDSTNGSYLTFNDPGNFYTTGLTTYSFFSVFAQEVTGNYRYILEMGNFGSGTNGGAGLGVNDNGTGVFALAHAAGGFLIPANSASVGVPVLGMHSNDGTTQTLNVNGTLAGSQANTYALRFDGNGQRVIGGTTKAVTNGVGELWKGTGGDQITVNQAMKGAELQEIETYLAQKYGTAGSVRAATGQAATYDLTASKNSTTLLDDVLDLKTTALGAGNDTVTTAGADYVSTGAGKDTVIIKDTAFRYIDGGLGDVDTLKLDASFGQRDGMFLADYVSNARGTSGNTTADNRVNGNGFHKLYGFEVIDLANSADRQSLSVGVADVNQLSDTNTLYVNLGCADAGAGTQADNLAVTGFGPAVWGHYTMTDASDVTVVYDRRYEGTDGSTTVTLYARGGAFASVSSATSGGTGSNIIASNTDETLAGTSAADTFVWGTGTFGTDTVTGFKLTDGDKIDLRDLLAFKGVTSANLSSYLSLSASTTDPLDAVLKIDTNGDGESGLEVPVQTIVFVGAAADLGTNLSTLLNNGVLHV